MPIVILADYGGPETMAEVGPYLVNMFSDPEILQVNRWLRLFLSRVIACARVKKSRAIYARIGGGSPVNRNVRELCRKLNSDQDRYYFAAGFRYSKPSVRDAVKECREGDILLFPLFPHYSHTTYRTIYREGEWCPRVRMAQAYYNDPEWLSILEKRIADQAADFDPGKTLILLSAHSLPESFVVKGDPYIAQVRENAGHFQKRFPDYSVEVAFQSRLGPVKWVGPSLEEALRSARNRGLCQVLIAPIGFTVENSETLYELDIYMRDFCADIGFHKFARVPCVNDGDDFCNFIRHKVEKIL